MRLLYRYKKTSPYDLIKYGLLYNWYAATDIRKITSSDDWVVPTRIQIINFSTSLGGDAVAGGKLKETGLTYWASPNAGATNEVGFNARGAGYRDSISAFTQITLRSNLWTSTAYPFAPFNHAYHYSLYYNNDDLTVPTGGSYFYEGLAIRLLYVGAGTPTEYVGNDGKTYRIILIGSQYWLADNLAETKFRNGDYIHGYEGGTYTPIADVDWAALSAAALCAYSDDTNNI